MSALVHAVTLHELAEQPWYGATYKAQVSRRHTCAASPLSPLWCVSFFYGAAR